MTEAQAAKTNKKAIVKKMKPSDKLARKHVNHNKIDVEKSDTTQSETTKKRKSTKMVVCISVGIGVLLIIAIAIIIFQITRQKRYDNAYSNIVRISVDGDFAEQCHDDMENLLQSLETYGNYCFCDGTLKIPAKVDENGNFESQEIILSAKENADLYKVKNFDDPHGVKIENGRYLIEKVNVEPNQYADISTLQYYRPFPIQKFMTVSLGVDSIHEVLSLNIVYTLSDDDRAIFDRLEQQRQAKIAEEKRIREEEEARQKEEARIKAEAEAARKKLANTPFTYTSSKCGFQGDVFCLLVSDFVADDLWKDRIKATFNDFINKTSAVTSTRHLIYIFKDASCYNEKISSKGLSVCDVSGGEIAVSQDTDGITWSYEK